MAGIFAILKQKELKKINKKKLKKYASKIKHRGSIHTLKYEKFPLFLFFHQDRPFTNNQILNFSFGER